MAYISLNNVIVFASGYPSYNFSGDKAGKSVILPSPDVFKTSKTIDGVSLGIGSLNKPQDIHMGENGCLYIVDTGNNRIVELNKEWKVLRVLKSFNSDGSEDTFNKPEGIFVTDLGEVYIADTGNKRVVILNAKGELIKIIKDIKSDMLPETFSFQPTKLVVTNGKVIYAVSRGMFEGLMEFGADGVFTGLVGANKVTPNMVDYFWKSIATKEQKKAMQVFIPTEFDNVDIDQEGFIYTVTGTVDENNPSSGNPVRRQSTNGANIIKSSKDGVALVGDLGYQKNGSTGITGPSKFVDVKAWDNGMYSCLDTKRGRIFTYDSDGNLLFVFGGSGNLEGMFKYAISIENYKDKLLVLDGDLGSITFFEPTEYGKLIISGEEYYGKGDYTKAAAEWKKVLSLNTNYELAYVGIGKALLRDGNYKEALTYFENGRNRQGYSKAFKLYREQVAMKYFTVFLICVATLIVIKLLYVKLLKEKIKTLELGKNSKVYQGLKYSLYIIFHPFDGFYDMKYEKRGDIRSACIIYVLAMFTYIFRRQYTGFAFNYNNLNELNIIVESMKVIFPVVLWCTANWCLTTLMEGEGSFKDVFMATAYAIMPFILINIPVTIISNFLIIEESTYITLFQNIAIIWSAFLLFAGMLSVHQYQAGKTLTSMGGTVLSMGIMVFIGMLFFNLLQQLFVFGYTIYSEVILRL